MSYFKHMVSYKYRDSALGNGGGFTVVWWQFNWIAINTTKKKKKGTCHYLHNLKWNTVMIFFYIYFWSLARYRKISFGDRYWRLLRKHQLKCIPGRFPVMAFHVWAHRGDIEREKRKLQNEPGLMRKGLPWVHPRMPVLGPTGQAGLLLCLSIQQKVLSLPILTPQCSTFFFFFFF